MDYLEVIESIIHTRIFCDLNLDCTRPRSENDPAENMRLWVEEINTDDGLPEQERQEMLLTAKVADLLDDRKPWLLKEIREDIYRIEHPGCFPAEIEIPDRGHDSDWWFSQEWADDFSMGMNGETGTVWLSADIEAETREEADAILRERVEELLRAQLTA